MSLKNKFISIFTVAAGVVVFSTAGFAQDTKTTVPTTPDKDERPERGEGRKMGDHKFGREGFGGRHGERGGMGGDRMMLRGLNLTEAQKAQLKTIRENNKPDAATMAELKAIREARKAGTAITPEQQARVKAIREQAQAKAKSVREQIQGILTAEQKAKLEQRRTEMKERFEQRRDHRELRQKDPATKTDKPKIS